VLDTKSYYSQLISHLENLDHSVLDTVTSELRNVWLNEKQLWIAGNGGNSANSDHFATDFSKGIFSLLGKPIKARSLTENTALFSALANDIPQNQVFSFQLQMLGKDGDFAILMSAGGSSQNIQNCATLARNMGIRTLGLLGGNNPPLQGFFDYEIVVKEANIQLVEDVHATIGHSLMLNFYRVINTTS